MQSNMYYMKTTRELKFSIFLLHPRPLVKEQDHNEIHVLHQKKPTAATKLSANTLRSPKHDRNNKERAILWKSHSPNAIPRLPWNQCFSSRASWCWREGTCNHLRSPQPNRGRTKNTATIFLIVCPMPVPIPGPLSLTLLPPRPCVQMVANYCSLQIAIANKCK